MLTENEVDIFFLRKKKKKTLIPVYIVICLSSEPAHKCYCGFECRGHGAAPSHSALLSLRSVLMPLALCGEAAWACWLLSVHHQEYTSISGFSEGLPTHDKPGDCFSHKYLIYV